MSFGYNTTFIKKVYFKICHPCLSDCVIQVGVGSDLNEIPEQIWDDVCF